MTSPKVVSVLLCSAVICFASHVQAGNLLVNGDFEDTEGWGVLGTGNPPAGWYHTIAGSPIPPVQLGTSQNPAVQQSGANAIGGSGTSAFLPRDETGLGEWRQLMQQVSTGPLWQFDVDFATEDPLAGRTLHLYLAANANSTNQIILRVVAGTETGYGSLQHWNGSGWAAPSGFANSVILDSDVETSPLTHHLTVVGDYSQTTRTYDLHLTDSNNVLRSATGLTGFNGTPAQGSGIELVRFVQNNDSPTIGYDYLIDNVSLITVPEPAAVVLLISAFAAMLVWRRRS